MRKHLEVFSCQNKEVKAKDDPNGLPYAHMQSWHDFEVERTQEKVFSWA